MEVNLEMGEEKGPFPQKVGLIRRKNQGDGEVGRGGGVREMTEELGE